MSYWPPEAYRLSRSGLAHTQVEAPLLQEGVKAILQPGDELVGPDRLCRRHEDLINLVLDGPEADPKSATGVTAIKPACRTGGQAHSRQRRSR